MVLARRNAEWKQRTQMFGVGGVVLVVVATVITGIFKILPAEENTFIRKAHADTATTTVSLSVCGNGIVEGTEVCDSGLNNGAYSSSTEGKVCKPGCMSGYGPFCGDGILQPQFGEECDDGNNISGDYCSSICKAENVPSGGGGGGGGGSGGGPYPGGTNVPPVPTKVVISGKAYPNAEVHVLRDGTEIARLNARDTADFSYEVANATPGITTFSIWAYDGDGVRSDTLPLTFRVSPNAITTITGVYLPPTVNLSKNKVKQGDTIRVTGQTISGAHVLLYLDSGTEPVQTVLSAEDGRWSYTLATDRLTNETMHNLKVRFELSLDGAVTRSVLTQGTQFYVGENETGPIGMSADLNHDGKVNITDFSILLFYWNGSNPIADINRDGKVNITDFSIMLFQWTG